MRSELGRWSEMIVAGDPASADIAPAIENELLAMATLDTIHTHRLVPAEAVFIGGTALRLCYGSPRFSDDLHFHAPPNVHFENIDAEVLARELGATVGAEIAINHPTSECTSTLVRINAALPERTRDRRRPRTRIDMARSAKWTRTTPLCSSRWLAARLPAWAIWPSLAHGWCRPAKKSLSTSTWRSSGVHDG